MPRARHTSTRSAVNPCCSPTAKSCVTQVDGFTLTCCLMLKVRLKDSLVSSLQFCKAKDTELAWIDGVLDMRVIKVDTGVMLEEGMKEEAEDGDLAMDVAPDVDIDHSATAAAAQRAMKNLFGEDEKELSEESDVIPTLEPLPPHEVRRQVGYVVISECGKLFVNVSSY